MRKGLKEEQKRDSETGEEVEGEGREEQEVMYMLWRNAESLFSQLLLCCLFQFNYLQKCTRQVNVKI